MRHLTITRQHLHPCALSTPTRRARTRGILANEYQVHPFISFYFFLLRRASKGNGGPVKTPRHLHQHGREIPPKKQNTSKVGDVSHTRTTPRTRPLLHARLHYLLHQGRHGYSSFGRVPSRRSVATFRPSVAPFRCSVAPFRLSVALFRRSVAPFRRSVALFRRSVAPFRRSVALFRRSVAVFCRSVAVFCRSVAPFRRSVAPCRPVSRGDYYEGTSSLLCTNQKQI